MDFNKFIYKKKKQEKKNKNQNKVETKELRFTIKTEEHDLNFKINHAKNFLKDGNNVKAYIQFRGREIKFKEKGVEMLWKIAKRLEDHGEPKEEPQMEGKRMYILIRPKSNKD